MTVWNSSRRESGRCWWSLRPLKDVAPPEVEGSWPRDAVDRFVFHQLEQHRLAPNGFQTENVTFLSQRQTAWITLGDTAPANGIQRVAYEIATSDLNPNFPPRTGVATAGGKTLPPQDEGCDKRSWFGVTGIVNHEQAGQPLDDLGSRHARDVV